MQVAGIVAEYNPFHRGHLYHIRKTREAGATHIVAVMSGNFVQRGDFALFSKWSRARAAVEGGVDLVLELPAVYSLACAERFARAAVTLLDRFGVVSTLSFGSESGELSPLYEILNHLRENSSQIKAGLRRGLSYPQALAGAAGAALTPNNILGIEYLRALEELHSPIRPFTVQRQGAAHDAEELCELPSAKRCRSQILESGFSTVCPHLPAPASLAEDIGAGFAPCTLAQADRALLALLRTADFSRVPGISEGLEYRFVRALSSCATTAELIASVKTKRYSEARIRRIALCAALGITESLQRESPPYLRVLALNGRGAELLRLTPAEVVTKPAALLGSGECFEAELRACALFALSSPTPRPGNLELISSPVFLKTVR